MKKLLIGLSISGVGVLGLATAPESNAPNLQDFLNKVTQVSTSAFDRLEGKQVELTDYQSLARFLEGGEISPSSFETNPQPHLKWMGNRLSGDHVVKLDLGSPQPTEDLKLNFTADLLTLIKNLGYNQDAAASTSFAMGVVHGLFQADKSVAGYSITNTAEGYEINVATVVGNDDGTNMNEQLQTKAQSLMSKVLENNMPGIKLVNTTYSSDMIEVMSSLGPKGATHFLNFEEINNSFVNETNSQVLSEDPQALGVLALAGKIKKAQKSGSPLTIEPEFVNALNAYEFTRYNEHYLKSGIVTSEDLVKAAQMLPQDWDSSLDNAKLSLQFSAAMRNIVKAEAHPSTQAIKAVLDEPCSDGVSHTLTQMFEDPGFVKAFECANEYGYNLPQRWMDLRLDSTDSESELAPPTLLGFDKGIAVFAASNMDHRDGFSYSEIAIDDQTGKQIYKGDYETTYTVVNPFAADLAGIEPEMHALTMQFIAKHELAHSQISVARHGEVINQSEQLRDVSEEIDCDMIAVQDLIREGYSPAKVQEMHAHFLRVAGGSEKFLEFDVDQIFVDDLRSKVWVGSELMGRDEVQRSLSSESGIQQLEDKMGNPSSAEIFELTNGLEFAARHAEVKRAIEEIRQGQPINVLEGYDIEQRKTFAQSQ